MRELPRASRSSWAASPNPRSAHRPPPPVWKTAPAITNFTQREPNQGNPGSQRTEVRVAYDDEAIYEGARMHDAHPDSIVKALSRRDTGGSHSDEFKVFLDPYHDRRSGYYFTVNVGGTLYEARCSTMAGTIVRGMASGRRKPGSTAKAGQQR